MDSLKKRITSNFSNIPLVEGLENYKVVLVTPSGIIMGTPVGNNEDDNDLFLTSFVNSVTDKYRKDHSIPDDEYLDGNDGFIYLKDVTIQNGAQNTSLPILCVFYDQIVGVSIGEITD
ncbi:MAG: hypothetical protein ACI4EX_01665 [Lachnospiraceae bacterium]